MANFAKFLQFALALCASLLVNSASAQGLSWPQSTGPATATISAGLFNPGNMSAESTPVKGASFDGSAVGGMVHVMIDPKWVGNHWRFGAGLQMSTSDFGLSGRKLVDGVDVTSFNATVYYVFNPEDRGRFSVGLGVENRCLGDASANNLRFEGKCAFGGAAAIRLEYDLPTGMFFDTVGVEARYGGASPKYDLKTTGGASAMKGSLEGGVTAGGFLELKFK